MKSIVAIIFVVFGSGIQLQELITASRVADTDYRFRKNLDHYKNDYDNGRKMDPAWTIWSTPFEKIITTSSLKSKGNIVYSAENLSDFDLNTAWVEGVKEYGIGEKIEVTLGVYGKHYGEPFSFRGEVVLFNGYCKTDSIWNENSRVKKFLMSFNEIPVCEILLEDTWHLQHFDVSKYFKSNEENLEAPFNISSENDKLVFEIIEVYKGSKYDDVCISEFMFYGSHEHKSFDAPKK